MSSIYQRKDGNWVYQCRVNGKQKIIYLGKLDNKTIAKYKKTEFDILYRSTKNIPKDKIHIKKILHEYYNILALRCSNDKHISNTKRRINRFIENTDIYYVSQITRNKIESFLHQRKQLNKSDLTLKNELVAIKGLLNWCVKNEYLTNSPAQDIVIAKSQKRPPNFLTKPQIKELLEKAENYSMRYMIYISLSTGVRPNELQAMEWEDWDFDREILTIPKAKSRYWRTIPFNRSLTDRIKPIIKNKGKCFDYAMIPPRKQFNKLLKELSFDFIYYDLRSTFACQLLLDGVNPENVRQLLGHTSLNTTMRYVRALGNYQKEAIKDFNVFC